MANLENQRRQRPLPVGRMQVPLGNQDQLGFGVAERQQIQAQLGAALDDAGLADLRRQIFLAGEMAVEPPRAGRQAGRPLDVGDGRLTVTLFDKELYSCIANFCPRIDHKNRRLKKHFRFTVV